MRRAQALALSGLLLLTAVPALAATRSVREQVDSIELDIRDLQAKVLEMQEVQASIQASLADLRSALALDAPGRRTPADLAARLDSVETDLRVMQENQNDLRQRASVLSDKVDTVYRRQAQMAEAAAAAAQPPVTGDPAVAAPDVTPPAVEEEQVGERPAGEPPTRSPAVDAGEPLVDPEELYQAARADYGRGSYDLALSGFQEFIERFPDSELADNALYWVGECHYSAGRLPEAISAFDELAGQHEDSDKVPDAGYKKGLALLELNRTADGIIVLQRVKDTWPNAPAGRLARTKLQSMGLL